MLGAVHGVQSANRQNAERERAIADGTSPPERASATSRGVGYGLIGLAIDVAIIIVAVPRIVPHE